MRRLATSLSLILLLAGLATGCKPKAVPKPVDTEDTETSPEPAKAPAGPLPLEIAPGNPPDVILSHNGQPIPDPILGNASVDDVREGGLSVTLGGDRIDIALRVTPEPFPPFVRGELLAIDYKPLPPPSAKSVDVMLRRGKGETARTIEFARLRMMMPVMRYLADGQVGVEQVGGPHPAKEGDGRTPYGLDVAVTVGGKRAIAHAGDVVPLTLREGAVDLTVVSSLLRGGSITMTGNVPPYILIVVLAPSQRPADLANPAGPNGQSLMPKR